MRPDRVILLCAGCAAGLLLTGCGTSSPRFTARETARGISPSVLYQLSGIASYYADEFNGRKTANGEIFDMHDLTAAHRTLPFNSIVRVQNLENGKSVTVRINDRGPFKDNRVIDLSFAAARKLDLVQSGTAPVKLEIVQLGSLTN
jgi:peptidoglycan lytic transglycosylase